MASTTRSRISFFINRLIKILAEIREFQTT